MWKSGAGGWRQVNIYNCKVRPGIFPGIQVQVSFQVGSLPTQRMGVAGASMAGVLHVSGGSDFTSVQS